MNTLISKIEHWYRSRSARSKLVMDVAYHVLLAYSILLIIGGLTFYLGAISSDLFIYAFLLALFMIPLRILTLRYLKKCEQHDYLNQVLQEILCNDSAQNTKPNPQDDDADDDDWFMKIAKGG